MRGSGLLARSLGIAALSWPLRPGLARASRVCSPRTEGMHEHVLEATIARPIVSIQLSYWVCGTARSFTGKANGQPDWPTRVAAARALAALPPEQAGPEPEQQREAQAAIVVYDLPPGAEPVLHRPRIGNGEPAEARPTPPPGHGAMWVREDTDDMIAQYLPSGNSGSRIAVCTLSGTTADIDRQAAALIEALSSGTYLPTFD